MRVIVLLLSLAIAASAVQNLITNRRHLLFENYIAWSRELIGESAITWSKKAEEIAMGAVAEDCNPRSLRGILMDKKAYGYFWPVEYFRAGRREYLKTKTCNTEACYNFLKLVNPKNVKFGCAIVYCPSYPTFTFVCAFLDENDKLVYTGKSLDETAPTDVEEPIPVTPAPVPAGTIGSKVTAAEKEDLVILHNKVRNEASASIPKLVWSAELAESSQAHASKCVFKHSDTNNGENLAMGTAAYYSLKQLAQLWVDERKDYTYATNQCSAVCGHYTQMVWKKTLKVGCGVAICGNNKMLVCQYDPPGNYIGQKPY